MTIVDGWFDFAVKEPGPPDRRQRFNNTLSWITFHSLEGVRGGYSVMNDPNRPGIAWHGTIGYDGILYQHYPIEAGLFHGGPNANPYSPGFETEGGLDDGDIHTVDEPLNPAQKHTVQLIIINIEEYKNRPYTRANGGIRQHGELAQTACPSNRYDTLWEEMEGMTKDEVLELIKEMQNNGELASTTDVLACVSQIVGSETSTYSDTARVMKARDAITALATPVTRSTTKEKVS